MADLTGNAKNVAEMLRWGGRWLLDGKLREKPEEFGTVGDKSPCRLQVEPFKIELYFKNS